PEPSTSDLFRFDQGTEVGELAKQLFPEGINIPDKDFKENLELTKKALKKKKPLFEAGIGYNDLFSRADILVPIKDQWDIIEVKSSTEVKDVNLHDVSFQKHVYEKAGLKIRKCFLCHINKEFRKKGKIKPKELLKLEDITKEVDLISVGIEKRIEDMLGIIVSKTCPKISLGPYCKDPYECAIDCQSELPDGNVLELYRIGKKGYALLDENIELISELQDTYKLSDKQHIQKKCSKTKKPYIQKESLRHFLKPITEPIYFLDFETFATAIPIYDNTKPYQNIPFQFSLHIKDKSLKHISFLHKTKSDPRLQFLKELKKSLGDKGPIVVYNQSFEKGRLKELAEAYPKYEKWVESVNNRMVDLLIPFRNFHYYHPKQKGSASIKVVLPAVTGKSYKDLDIASGGDASVSYYNVIFKKGKNKAKVMKDLEKYCGLDTVGMVWILEELRKLV
ncbi:MAG: DUF2779 domain-containing protein, partial [archaeon]